MQVKVGVSNRHIHINKEDYIYLFGDIPFTKRNDLGQPGEFASNFTVKISGPKGEIDNVRVVGPQRNYTQVEVSKTDCYKLGINAPVRNSGDLSDALVITIEYNDKSITKACCIIPTRHIHISSLDRKKYNLTKDYYKIKVEGEKASILDKVYIKEGENYNFELHLDTDDANANLIKTGDYLEIIED